MNFPGILNPYNWPGYLGYALPQAPATVDAVPSDKAAAKGDGPRTGDQSGWAFDAFGGGVNVGPESCPILPGCYSVWRKMDADPLLTLARVVTVAPILAGTRTFEVQAKPGVTIRRTPATGDGVRKDPLDQRAEWLAGVLDPLLPDLVRDMLRAPSLGHYSFEVPWGVADGREVVTAFKPLRPERTILVTLRGTGELVGLRNFGNGGGQVNKDSAGGVELWGRYFFNYAYDSEAGNPYGRPRHENARRAWCFKMEAEERLYQLDQKAVGTTMIVKGPRGTGKKDSAGNLMDGPNPAMKIAEELSKLRPVWMAKNGVGPFDPDQRTNLEYLKVYTELCKISQYDVEQFDWPHTGQATAATLSEIEYFNRQLMRAWHRPEREAMESQHGSKADSSNAGDTGSMDSDALHGDVCRAITRGPVADLLTRNYGEGEGDSVALVPASAQDTNIDKVMTFLTTLAANPLIAADIYKKLDKSKAFADAELPIDESVDPNEELPDPVAPPAPPATTPPTEAPAP